jgi:NADPH2:quinone reductase
MSANTLRNATMRAIVLDSAPAPPSGLRMRSLPIPKAQPGQVLIRVKAFGLNRSELLTRHGFSGPDVTFPRVLGIEAAGVVAEDAPGGEFKRGQNVAAIMGGLGRTVRRSMLSVVLLTSELMLAEGWWLCGIHSRPS